MLSHDHDHHNYAPRLFAIEVELLNQARAWFLEITSVRMCVKCVCVAMCSLVMSPFSRDLQIT